VAEVEIGIPPRSAYVAVVRLAVAALARQAGLDGDVVDNLRIAVSEACTTAVFAHEAAGSEDPIVIRWDDADDRLVVEVEDAAGTGPGGPAPEDSQGFATRDVMSSALLESLVDESSVARGAAGTISRLVLLKP
jgi:anti-sigma regulatory factor (Ser/Thr protein kinase)